MSEQPVLVIAEIGVNHDGSLERARQLVDAAAASGAGAAKFQTFSGTAVVRSDAAKARYQLRTTNPGESQLAMLQRLELSFAAYAELRDRCQAVALEFLSTPFDVPSLRSLVELGVSTIKLSSGDLTNEPLLREAGRTDCRLILSTGMATLGEVEWALGVVASNRLGIEDAAEALATALAQDGFRRSITLLHCTTDYPAPPTEVNLRALETLRGAFGLPVGYSDHTVGRAIPLAAVALGATVIEKHLTLDRTLPGPDHEASTEPEEFALMVREIRMVEAALGSGRKLPTVSERENRGRVRRSLVARTRIRAGEPFTSANLDVKRPADGIPASRYQEYLGRPARHDYDPDQPIDE